MSRTSCPSSSSNISFHDEGLQKGRHAPFYSTPSVCQVLCWVPDGLGFKEPANPRTPASWKQASKVQREGCGDKGSAAQQRMEQRAVKNSSPKVMPRPAPEVGSEAKGKSKRNDRCKSTQNGSRECARWEGLRDKGPYKPY